MSEFACECGAPQPRHVHESRQVCCWCWVVEHARDPHPGHPECTLTAKRIAPIRVRFTTAVRAEREACAQVVERVGSRAPLTDMPAHLRAAMRRDPDYVMRSVLDLLAKNTATVIRARIG